MISNGVIIGWITSYGAYGTNVTVEYNLPVSITTNYAIIRSIIYASQPGSAGANTLQISLFNKTKTSFKFYHSNAAGTSFVYVGY